MLNNREEWNGARDWLIQYSALLSGQVRVLIKFSELKSVKHLVNRLTLVPSVLADSSSSSFSSVTKTALRTPAIIYNILNINLHDSCLIEPILTSYVKNFLQIFKT